MEPEIKALQTELALLKLEFEKRIAKVEAQLNDALDARQHTQVSKSQLQHTAEPTSPQFDQAPVEPSIGPTADTSVSKTTPALEATTSTVKGSTATAGGTNLDEVNPWLQAQKPSHQVRDTKESHTEKDSKSLTNSSSFFSAFFQALFGMILEWLSPVIEIYRSYKARGALGTLALTIVGVGLTLSGFGYLMQLLIGQLGVGAKALFMCTGAVLVSGLGIGLKVRTTLDEFSTAIITLGMLLAYSTVYFSGSVHGLLPDSILLFLYLLIALSCHGLGHWLDTKVVARLGIIGIATMPVLSNSLMTEPTSYLLSLAFVCVSSLVLAYKRKDASLANLTLVFCLVALEWAVAVESVRVAAWLVNLFYLVFFIYLGLTLFRNTESDKSPLILLAALVGATVMLFFQAGSIFTQSVSAAFTLNAVLGLVACFAFYRFRHTHTHLLVLVTLLWAILAVVSAISQAYWGIAWAIEGLLLLFVGRKYNLHAVVSQGQALTALALLYCLSGLAPYFPLPALATADGWLLALVALGVISTWLRWINDAECFGSLTQNKIKPSLQFLEAAWISLLLVCSADIWLGNWTGALVILLQVALLFRAKYLGRASIERLAVILIAVPLYYGYQGAQLVDSFRFFSLPLFAKVALVSAFAQLWLWSAFNEKFNPDSRLREISQGARILFYLLLPVIWLGSAWNRLEDNIFAVIWASPLIALLLAVKIRHLFLVNEAKMLACLASFGLVVGVATLSVTPGLLSLVGFAVLVAVAWYLEKQTANRSEGIALSQLVTSCGVLALGFAAPIFIGFQASSLLYGLGSASIIWVGMIASLNKSAVLNRNEFAIVTVNFALLFVAWVSMSLESWLVMVPVLFILSALVRSQSVFGETRLGVKLDENKGLFLHSVAVFSYASFLAWGNAGRIELLIGPLLALHGACILFSKDRRMTTVRYSFALIALGIAKLALVDAANALLWQKVILFMGVGVLILLASFWYQKLVAKSEVVSEVPPETA